MNVYVCVLVCVCVHVCARMRARVYVKGRHALSGCRADVHVECRSRVEC